MIAISGFPEKTLLPHPSPHPPRTGWWKNYFLRHGGPLRSPPRSIPDRDDMIFQIAVLCDAATDYNGKLNLLGSFDTINTSQLPAIHPQCSVALRIAFSRIEEGQHKVKVNFVDDDGKFVMPSIDMPVDVVIPPDASFQTRNFLINIQQLKFDNPGQYSIDVAINGRHEISIPLLVRLQPPDAPPQFT